MTVIVVSRGPSDDLQIVVVCANMEIAQREGERLNADYYEKFEVIEE